MKICSLTRLMVIIFLAVLYVIPATAQQITFFQKARSTKASENTKYVFSMQDALKMPQYSMETSTNWTKEESFKGVKMSEVLKRFGLDGKVLHFVCYDGYDYRISMSDVAKYGLLLAFEKNGKMMAIKTLGPFALIYPRSTYPDELGGPDVDAKFIWMIKKIYVE